MILGTSIYFSHVIERKKLFPIPLIVYKFLQRLKKLIQIRSVVIEIGTHSTGTSKSKCLMQRIGTMPSTTDTDISFSKKLSNLIKVFFPFDDKGKESNSFFWLRTNNLHLTSKCSKSFECIGSKIFFMMSNLLHSGGEGLLWRKRF